jgi:hypothetical protein
MRTLLLFACAAAACCCAEKTATLENFSKLPLNFEQNQGQAPGKVKYLARGIGYTVFLTGNETVLALHEAQSDRTRTVRMRFAGARNDAAVEGMQPLPGRANYLIGNESSNWHTGIPTFGRVRYTDPYPGIDVVFYGNQGELEYDFVVTPGAEPSQIRLSFEGASGLQIDDKGDLILIVGSDKIHLRRPVIYQTDNGGRHLAVDGHFVKRSSHEAGFEVARYDRSRVLVIDPAIVRSTFLGGTGADIGYGIAVDGQGFVYVTGGTNSVAGFPAIGCFQCPPVRGPLDAFVTKFIPGGGGFVYSTYLGGAGTDAGYSIAADPAGRAYVTGFTNSPNFPLFGPAMPPGGGPSDAFVTALSPVGFPIYSTYLGGANADIGYGITVDTAGDAYVTGMTQSLNFPALNCFQCANQGGQDAFVTGFNPAGVLLFSSYLGGKGNDIGYGISLDANREIGVTGSTTSKNFPVLACPQCALAGGSDAFASTLVFPGGPLFLKWSTYWGGAANEAGYGITLSGPGQGWITGYTTSVNFPVTPTCVQCVYGGNQDAIVVNFNIAAVPFSDFLGGAGRDTGRSIAGRGPAAVAPGVVYLTGDTASLNFPVINPLPVVGAANNGGVDAFFAEYTLAAAPIRIVSSYLGGKANDVGRGIALGPQGAYVTGNTFSANFPIKAPCTQCVYSGGGDAFVTVIK